MVSQYFARLPDRVTNTFWRDAPLGDTSMTASTPLLASWHFVQLASVGMKGGTWVEPKANGWRERRSQQANWSRRAEPTGEWVGCRSQARQNELTGMKKGTMGRNDT